MSLGNIGKKKVLRISNNELLTAIVAGNLLLLLNLIDPVGKGGSSHVKNGFHLLCLDMNSSLIRKPEYNVISEFRGNLNKPV